MVTRMRILHVLIGAVVAIAAGTAHAERTAILVAGNATPHERDVSLSAITASVAAQGGDIVNATFTAKETALIRQCLTKDAPWTCMRSAVTSKGIEQLVIGSIDTGSTANGPSLELTGHLVVATLNYAIADKRHCDPCTDDLLTNLAGELTQSQLRRLAVLRARTLVAVHTMPRGARVTFDRETQGAGELVIPTYPGGHTVQVELEGYHVETRTVTAVEGKTIEVNVTLRPNGKPVQRPIEHVRPSRTVPILIGSVGIAALITGGVLIATHGTPSTDPNASQDEFYYATRTPGIAMAVGGALVIGASVYLWRRQSRSAVIAAPVSGGATVGWYTSF